MSVLDGMTRKEAEAWLGGLVCVNDDIAMVGVNRDAYAKLLALAALGAKVVGAREWWLRTTSDVLESGGSAVLSWAPLGTANSVVVVRRVLVLEAE